MEIKKVNSKKIVRKVRAKKLSIPAGMAVIFVENKRNGEASYGKPLDADRAMECAQFQAKKYPHLRVEVVAA